MTNHTEALAVQIQALVAEALGLSPDQMSPDLAFGDLPEWDSMGHMEIILRLEEDFGVEVDAELIAELTSIPAIYDFLAGRESEE